MKKILVILTVALVLIIAGSGTGFYLINEKLKETETGLQEAFATISTQDHLIKLNQAEVQDLRSELADNQGQIDTLESRIDGEVNDLTNQVKDTTSLLNQKISENIILGVKSDGYQQSLNNTRLQLETADRKLKEAQEVITLSEHTTGVASASRLPEGKITAGTEGRPFRVFQLARNPKAVDPTYDELIKFLEKDTTSEKPYIEDTYTCGNYAEEVFNNAQSKGIRAAVVDLRFKDDAIGHALNAFMTTDEGLVYIDCTGRPDDGTKPQNVTSEAYPKIGLEYEKYPIFSDEYYFVSNGKIVESIEICKHR